MMSAVTPTEVSRKQISIFPLDDPPSTIEPSPTLELSPSPSTRKKTARAPSTIEPPRSNLVMSATSPSNSGIQESSSITHVRASPSQSRRSASLDTKNARVLRNIVGDLANRVLLKHRTAAENTTSINSCFVTSDDKDVPINVSVSVGMRKLININVESQTFEAEIFCRASWIDPSISELYENDEMLWFADPHYDDDDRMNCWSPRIQVENLKGNPERFEFWFVPENGTRVKDYFKIGRDNREEWRVSQVMKFQGTFLMKMNLRAFPFDEHYLEVKLKSCVPAHAPENHPLRYGKLIERDDSNAAVAPSTVDNSPKRNLKLSRLQPFTDLNERGEEPNVFHQEGFFEEWSWWAARALVLSSNERQNQDSVHGVTYSMITARLHVVRDPWAYLINVMLVHGAICTCVLAVVSFSDSDARIDSIFQLLTAAVAHKFVAIQNLPELPHATQLDIFIFCGLLLIFSALIETVVITQYSEDTREVDFYFLIIAGSIWGLYLLCMMGLIVSFWLYGKKVNGTTSVAKHALHDESLSVLEPPRANCVCFRACGHKTLAERFATTRKIPKRITVAESTEPTEPTEPKEQQPTASNVSEKKSRLRFTSVSVNKQPRTPSQRLSTLPKEGEDVLGLTEF